MITIQAAQRLQITAGRETGVGAGALFYALDTGRFLWMKRSNTCDQPGTWCGLGGGVEHDDPSIEDAVLREANEEAGFDTNTPVDLHHIDTQESPDFTFHNYLAILDHEFEPILNPEHTDYQWCAWADTPDPVHPGLAAALETRLARLHLRRNCAGHPY